MDVLERIDQQVKNNPIVIFMKGTPELPMCGFSMRAAAALTECRVPFAFVNVLQDPEIFENLRNLTVISANPDGTERSIYEVAKRDSVHPVIVALQAAESLRKRGESLKKGDVISVGAMMEEFIDPAVPIEGKRHVHYYIGDTVISVAAGFRE